MKRIWLRRFDLLNVPTSLSYKNEYFYATNIGAILTILFSFVIISIATYEIIVLCNKTTFSLISNQYTDLSQAIDFSRTPFLFQLSNEKGKLIDIDNKLFVIEDYNMEMTFTIEKYGTKKKKD